eukprot:Gb_20925 [translate_table: standard]
MGSSSLQYSRFTATGSLYSLASHLCYGAFSLLNVLLSPEFALIPCQFFIKCMQCRLFNVLERSIHPDYGEITPGGCVKQASWGPTWGVLLSPTTLVSTNVDSYPSMVVKNAQKLRALQSNSKGEGSLQFPKTLRIDNPKGASGDGQNDYGCMNFGGLLRVTNHYGSRGCFVVSSNTQVLLEEQFNFLTRGIKLVSILLEQCQVGLMLESARIIDSKGDGKGKFPRKWIVNTFISGSNRKQGKKFVGVDLDEKLLDLLEPTLSTNTPKTMRSAGDYKLANIKGKGTFFHRHALTEELERLQRALKILAKVEKQLAVSNDQTTWPTTNLLQFGSRQSHLVPTSYGSSVTQSPIDFKVRDETRLLYFDSLAMQVLDKEKQFEAPLGQLDGEEKSKSAEIKFHVLS